MHAAGSDGETPLRVAFLSPSWPPEGAANGIVNYVDQVVGGLRRLGHQPCILSVTGGGEWPDVYFLERTPRPTLARIIDPVAFRIAPNNAARRWYSRNLSGAVARAVAERCVQLVEMEETFGVLREIRPRLGIPVVIRLHGPYFANAKASGIASGALFRRRVQDEGAAIALADAVSAPSRSILDRTREHYGLPLDDAVVIPPPAPLVPKERRWRLEDCDRSRILFLGRFDRHKGGDVVIECLRMLLGQFPNLRLWFTGTEASFLDCAGRSWSLADYIGRNAPEAADRVDWLGGLPDAEIAALRRKAFLTFVASRYETFGLVALEAMAYGCPLVATETGGIAEIVTDGVNGLLCKPADPTAMARQAARLLQDHELAARLGQRAGQDAAELYHPDSIARQTADFHGEHIRRWRRQQVAAR
jgi:glycosyltransferase involved in cell wall biosynthesis